MDERPRCPLRVAAFDLHDTCDTDCAWLVEMRDNKKSYRVCAIAAIAANNYLFDPVNKYSENPSN